MTEKTTENCCATACCDTKNCCSGKSLWISLGRIVLGVMLLGAAFLFGLKSGMMMDGGMRGGYEGKKGGCMMEKMMGHNRSDKQGCGCMGKEGGGCMMGKEEMNKPIQMNSSGSLASGDVAIPSTGTLGTGA